MATGKLSPRQKMINMMYLVLLALLALNVSKEILKSFHLMEVSFNRAKENLDTKIKSQISSFEEQASNDPTLKPYYERALEAEQITDKFVQYIEKVKTELADKTGGRQEFEEGDEGGKSYEAELVGTDNMEVHANYFMIDNDEGAKVKGWKGKELEGMINATRDALLDLLNSDKDNGVDIKAEQSKAVIDACQLSALLTDKESIRYESWSAKYLENTPLAGVIAMLTKIQTDAKSTQGAVMDVLHQGKVAHLPISGLVSLIKPVNGSVIMNGGTYEAEIILAAETQGNDNTSYSLETGEGRIEKRGERWYYVSDWNSSGNHDFERIVTVKTPDGDKQYKFDGGFQVFNGGATISATRMNVLYIGVENDISVGVPGVNPHDVTVSMTGGRITKKGANYIATCTQKGTAVISASARMSDGTIRRVGSQPYRVKMLPTPKAYIGAIGSGAIVPARSLPPQRKIVAHLGESFVFGGIEYRVNKYQFSVARKHGDPYVKRVNGALLTPEIIRVINSLRKGDRIIVDRIRATGPDGQKTLDPILIEII